MIIYMYLTIIVVFSILTGIITTIIEKKGYRLNTQKSIVQSVNVPNKVVRARKKNSSVLIPVIQPDEDLSKTIDILSITQEFDQVTVSNSEKSYSSEPAAKKKNRTLLFRKILFLRTSFDGYYRRRNLII